MLPAGSKQESPTSAQVPDALELSQGQGENNNCALIPLPEADTRMQSLR